MAGAVPRARKGELRQPEAERLPAPRRNRMRRGLLLVVPLLALAVGMALGVDVGGWFADIASDIRSVPPCYIAIACVLKGLEALLTALAWRNILRAAFPAQSITYKFVFGAYQGGAGINAVTPANAGTLMMLGLYRVSIPGAGAAAIVSAAVVQNLLFTVIAVLSGAVLLLTQPAVLDTTASVLRGTAAFMRENETLALVAGVVLVTLLAVFVVWLRRKISDFRQQAVRGGAILRTPRRYVTHVALPQLLAYACRWGVAASLLAGMAIPVTVHSIFLVLASNSLANTLQIAPGGLGTTQAMLVVALRDYADASTATAYSLVQSTILTLWNVAFGFVALALAFGISGARTILSRRHHITAEERAGNAKS